MKCMADRFLIAFTCLGLICVVADMPMLAVIFGIAVVSIGSTLLAEVYAGCRRS